MTRQSAKVSPPPPAVPSPKPAKQDLQEAGLRALLADSLWPGRTVLHVKEVSAALHITVQHVLNLITEGQLQAVNIAGGLKTEAQPGGRKSRRDSWRIPVSAWDLYIRNSAS